MGQGDPTNIIERKVTAGRSQAMPAPLTPTVKDDFTTTPADFAGAFDKAALSPTTLGIYGAAVAQAAGSALAQKRGQELGQNPIGDILPPITKADEAYSQAYNAQSEATLSIQAKKMMFQGQEELDKLGSLSSGNIQAFQTQMNQGLQDLLKVAPTQTKTGLQKQFGYELLNATHSYNEKLITQNKAAQLTTALGGIQSSVDSIYNQFGSGHDDLATQTYTDALASISHNLNAGIITKSQALAAQTTLSTTYNGAKVGNMLLRAKENNTLPQALDDLNKGVGTEGLNQIQRDAANAYGFKMVKTALAYSAEKQQAVTAFANEQIAANTMTDQTMVKLRTELNPKSYFDVQTKYLTHMQKQMGTKQKVSDLASNLSDISLMSVASDKDINMAADLAAKTLIEEQKNQGNDLSSEDAELLVGKEAVANIPQLKNKITMGLLSQDPAQVFQSSQMLDSLNDDGASFYKIPDGVLARAEMVKIATDAGQTPEQAVELGDSLSRITPDEKIMVQNKIATYKKDHWNSPEGILKWAVNATGIEKNLIRDPTAFATNAQSDYLKWMTATKGDEVASSNMLKKEFDRSWGTTGMNGEPETMINPPEVVSKLGEQSTFIFQDQLHQQIQTDFESTRKMYDAGGSSSYYKTLDRQSVDDFISSDKKTSWSPFSNKFLNGEPVKAYKYYRNGTITPMELIITPNIAATPSQSLDNAKAKVSYTVLARDPKTGLTESIPGFYGTSHVGARFTPDIEDAQLKFNKLNKEITGNLNSVDYIANRKPKQLIRPLPELGRPLPEFGWWAKR